MVAPGKSSSGDRRSFDPGAYLKTIYIMITELICHALRMNGVDAKYQNDNFIEVNKIPIMLNNGILSFGTTKVRYRDERSFLNGLRQSFVIDGSFQTIDVILSTYNFLYQRYIHLGPSLKII